MREVRVASLVDVQPGSMRQVTAAGVEILVARVGDTVCATSPKCSHYGGPLAEGVLHGCRVVCPWHHAVFDVTTGRQLEPPGCGDLQSFSVRVEGGEVWVAMDAPSPATPAPKEPASDDRLMVLVGAGAAGTSAAIGLRQQGYGGRIVLLSREHRLPYDRTLLSKEVLQGAELPCPIELHPETFYREQEIELRLGCEVRSLDAASRSLRLRGDETLRYDACLVATGGNPRRLSVPGADLPGIFTLRSWEDSDQLMAALASSRRTVIVGSSFIGLECAASLRTRGVDVTVVTPEECPFARLFGARIGAALLATHQAQGTKFVLGDQVTAFHGDARLEGVTTKSGARISSDLAIIGIGIDPVTDFITGLERADDGGILVDEYLQAAEGLFAAGDIATFTLPLTGERQRIEHWRLACEHGTLAARNMLGQRIAYAGVPFFWSAQKLALYYVGHADPGANAVIDGEPGRGPFIAYYSQDGNVVAALGVDRNAEMAALQELAQVQRLPKTDEVTRGFNALTRLYELSSEKRW